jgi:NADPH-dependent 2,4-dienoyl-CoA reductase/sulfur reductase-like enzyme
MRILVIGGSDAGISAALRVGELDRTADVTVLLADEYPNWSICGLPYFLGGETPDWRSLAHRTEFAGITLLRQHRAERIEPAARTVTVRGPGGGEHRLPYDRLIVATGAVPVRPELPGLELPGVHVLHTMQHALDVQRVLDSEPPPKSALVVGAGYIGLEMAEALVHRGLSVTVASRSDPVFPSVDAVFGHAITEELTQHGVRVAAGTALQCIERDGICENLVARGSGGFEARPDLILVATGVQPDTRLAAASGAELGTRGAIRVDRSMRTSVPDLLAAGDCAETWHRLLERNTYLPLGTTAHKQGRIAGETALDGKRLFAGSVGTQVVKLFDLAVARTGLLEREAAEAGFDPATAETVAWDHKAYYPGARRLRVRVTGDRQTGRLLGAQILGSWQGEVAKRIDVFAAALFHEMRVQDISDLDLSYAPPFSSPWDPVQMAAQAWAAECGLNETAAAVRGADFDG